MVLKLNNVNFFPEFVALYMYMVYILLLIIVKKKQIIFVKISFGLPLITALFENRKFVLFRIFLRCKVRALFPRERMAR